VTTIVAVAVALTIGAATAVVASGGSVSAERAQRAGTTAFTPRERALLAYVPTALRAACRGNTAILSRPFRGTRASLFCEPANLPAGDLGITLLYVQFSDAALLNTAYQTYLRNVGQTENVGSGDACPQEKPYKVDGNVGRTLCTLIAGVTPDVVSTANGSKILFYVEGSAGPDTASQVWQYWRSSAQPLKSPKKVT